MLEAIFLYRKAMQSKFNASMSSVLMQLLVEEQVWDLGSAVGNRYVNRRFTSKSSKRLADMLSRALLTRGCERRAQLEMPYLYYSNEEGIRHADSDGQQKEVKECV
ncbi:unnamed protein product [Toxocara canis]|uniref:Uncharacterized protein n=1 Tax=Toxocara canis TaxID=6265 RepID=A0A183V6V7_TOXCA|nr:unnamed protein product [Toxocara canis]